jgi:hypothetical protein
MVFIRSGAFRVRVATWSTTSYNTSVWSVDAGVSFTEPKP